LSVEHPSSSHLSANSGLTLDKHSVPAR